MNPIDRNGPKQLPNPMHEDVELTIISTYSYDIPLSVLKEQEKKDRCNERIKCICKCTIL